MNYLRNLIACLSLATISSPSAGEINQADIRVERVNSEVLGSLYNCNAVVKNSHDDDARNAIAIIEIPKTVKYEKFSITNNSSSKSKGKNDGNEAQCAYISNHSPHIECNLGNLSTQANLTINISGMVIKDPDSLPFCKVSVKSETPDKFNDNDTKEHIGINYEIKKSQEKIIKKLIKKHTTISINKIKIESDFINSDFFELDLKTGSPVKIIKSKGKKINEKSYLWKGNIESGGDASLIVNGKRITGTVENESGVYKIRPVGSDLHIIIKINRSNLLDHPANYQNEDLEFSGIPKLKKNSGDNRVDMLVLFNDEVFEEYNNKDDIKALIDHNISFEINQVFENNNINFTVNLNHFEQIEFNESEYPLDELIDELNMRGNDAQNSVSHLRDKHQADIVMLITSYAKEGSTTPCGIANTIGSEKSSAFIIVREECLLARYYTSIHEIGHLLGARHDTDPNVNPFAYGHGYVFDYDERCIATIMAIPVNCKRIPLWSNPSVEHEGVIVGSYDRHNNFRVVNENIIKLSGFYTSTQPEPIIVEKPEGWLRLLLNFLKEIFN